MIQWTVLYRTSTQGYLQVMEFRTKGEMEAWIANSIEIEIVLKLRPSAVVIL